MIEISSDVIDKIIKIVKDGGGEVYEQDGYINFCGVRDNTTNDTFNDTLYIYWKDASDGKFKGVSPKGFTTKPGKKSVLNTGGTGNVAGVAIVKEGWHPDIWHRGVHNPTSKNGHDALRQDVGVTKPITITRDKTQYGKTGTYELRIFSDTTESGYPYTNMHRSGSNSSNSVNGWSAGCQVFQYKDDFEEMISMADVAVTKGQKTFSYFLTNKNVFNGTDDNGSGDTQSNSGDNSSSNDYNIDNTSKKSSGVEYPKNNANLGSSGLNEVSSSNSKKKSKNKSSKRNHGKTECPSSFGVDVIFGDIFPKDDNNKYIDMQSEDIAVIQYTDPILKVDPLYISNKSFMSIGGGPDKISYYIPVVYINDFMIPQTNITNFCLDYTSFTPQVMVEFVDITNEMLSTNVPKPGSYIKVYIGGYGDEMYYKPIRQDFYITNINKTNRTHGEYQNYPNSGNPIKYKFTGMLNVPMGFRKMPWSTSRVNARQAMFDISNVSGLGFATNFDIDNKIDVMRWINTQNKSFFDFMREITQHSCYSPYTFFTSFIDQYNVVNYVECRRLLSHGGSKTDIPQIIYNCIMPEIGEEKTDKPDENLNSGNQKVSYYFLTNSAEFKGWTNYIEEYFELNDGYSTITDGHRKTLTYSDKCASFSVASKNFKFLITPIDNMKRDDDKRILSLSEDVTNDTYIPLNLMQTTSLAYIENLNLYDNPSAAEATIDMGEVDTSNTYPLYYYASVQNDFQMKYFRKCGLSVRLQNYNPAITKYSRIWVDIYDMNRNSLEQIRKNSAVDDMPESSMKDYVKEKNDNIITFEEEMEKDNETQVYNRSLSGWYVVTDMKISYNTVKDFKGNSYRKLQTQLVLNRIDYKPSFRSEYELAKRAIEIYKDENIPENILQGGDIM